MLVLCPLIADQMVFTKGLVCRFPVYSLIFGYITYQRAEEDMQMIIVHFAWNH